MSAALRHLLDPAERGLRDEHRSRPDERADLELGRLDDERAVDVPEGLDERLLVALGDHEQRKLLAPGGRKCDGALRRWLSEIGGVEYGQRALLRVVGKRSAERRLARLPVHLDLEGAVVGREGHSASRPLRSPGGALARTAGPLLAPRLRPPARDEAARLPAPRVLARGGRLAANGLVDEVRLHLGGEDGLCERHVLRLLAGKIEEGCFWRSHLRHHLLSSRMTTMPFRWPGTAPFRRSRFCSGSRSTTVRPTWVMRLLPICPAIFIPLKTREGVADAPID